MMKTVFIFGLLLSLACLLPSCSSDGENDFAAPANEVNFRINYTLSSGNMRSTASDAYDKFYQDHIQTRNLTPDGYSLLFTHKTNGQTIEVSGLWSDNQMVRMPEGTYTVTGKSVEGHSTYVSEKAILSFEDEIAITSDTESLLIKAQYASCLLFFSANDTKSVTYFAINYPETEYTTEKLPQIEGYYYAFMKAFGGTSMDYKSYFEVIKNGGTVTKLISNNLNIENGKYYFYDDISGGFDLEPMTPGN